MFCPRCGKDCKDANFCPSCGLDLRAVVYDKGKGEMVVFCPYCNNWTEKLADNHVCLRCGAPLAGQVEKKKPVLPAPPIGKYKQTGDCMEIGKDSVKFHKYTIFRGARERIVPYNEIVAVYFTPGAEFTPGFLCVRERKDSDVPVPTSNSEAIKDDTSIIFDRFKNATFYRAYEFLKQWADIVNAAEE